MYIQRHITEAVQAAAAMFPVVLVTGAHEIDLLIHRDGRLYPVEIEKSGDTGMHDIKAFKKLEGLSGVGRGNGALICFYERLLPIGKQDCIVPVWYL